MTKSKRVFTRILSLICALSLVFSCAWLTTIVRAEDEKATPEADEAITVNSSYIVSGICADAVNHAYTVSQNGVNYLSITAGYGTAVEDEKEFTSWDHVTISNGSNVSIGTTTWSGVAFFKIQVLKDASIRLYNPEFTHDGWFSWTNASVLKVNDGVKTVLCTSDAVNPNGETGIAHSWDEGKFFDCTVDVKAGDTLYFCVNGSEWGACINANLLNITVSEGEGAASKADAPINVNSSQIVSGICVDTANHAYTVSQNGVNYLSITAGYGTAVEDEKAFTSWDNGAISNGGNVTIKANHWYGVAFFKIQVLEDATIRLYNPTFSHDGWYSWTNISVLKVKDGVTTVLCTTDAINPNGESGIAHNWDEGKFFDCTVDAEAGDTLYYCVNGSEWGACINANPLNITVSTDASVNANSSQIVSGICADTVNHAYTASRKGVNYLSITAGYGTAVEDEKEFTSWDNGAISNGSNVTIKADHWYGVAFFKIQVLEDATIRLYNPTFSHDGWYSWTNISVLKVKDGVTTVLCTTDAINPNGESGIAHNWDEGKFFDCTVDAEAGDTLYYCVNGSEWGACINANPLNITVTAEDKETDPEGTVPEETVPEETVPEETVPEETVPEETVPEETVPEETVPEETDPEETQPMEVVVSNSDILAGIYDNTTDRTYTVMYGDEVLGTFTAGYGVIGFDEKAFESYDNNYFFQSPDYWFISSEATNRWNYWKVASDENNQSVFLKLEVAKDGHIALNHEAIDNSAWSSGAGFDFTIEVIRVRNGKTTTLSSVYSGETAVSFAADSMVKNIGNVKAGDVIYVAVTGNWSAQTHFNPVFTFEETKTDLPPETGDMMTMMPVMLVLMSAAGLIYTTGLTKKYGKA